MDRAGRAHCAGARATLREAASEIVGCDSSHPTKVEGGLVNGVIPVGVIGCGRMGRLHARVYSEMPSVKLVGVCDASPEAAATAADQFGCVAFATPEELLSQTKAVTV